MEGKSLVPGERYLYRFKGKQIPVIFLDSVRIGRYSFVRFCRIDNGDIFQKRGAGAISKHYDDCVWWFQGNCTCSARLAKEKCFKYSPEGNACSICNTVNQWCEHIKPPKEITV